MDNSSPIESSEFSGLGPSEKEPQRRFFDYSGPVESISLDGNTINWYTNVVEAATKTEVFEKGIKRCMKGDRITYGGLKWRRGAPQIIEQESEGSSSGNGTATEAKVEVVFIPVPAIPPVETQLQPFKTGVSIECMTQEGIVLHRFVDIKSIRKQANFPIERIQTVLRKQQQKSAGFYWRFYDESRVNDSSHLISIEELLSYKETSGDYKQLLPSQKKLKTRYDDISAIVIMAGKDDINGADIPCTTSKDLQDESSSESKDDIITLNVDGDNDECLTLSDEVEKSGEAIGCNTLASVVVTVPAEVEVIVTTPLESEGIVIPTQSVETVLTALKQEALLKKEAADTSREVQS